jgi:hypothetical protein
LGAQRINHFDGTADHCNGGLGSIGIFRESSNRRRLPAAALAIYRVIT